MKFEEALSAMREGKKIRHPSMAEDEYYSACYVGFKFVEESFEEKKARGMSIVKMKADKQHPDMMPSWEEVIQKCKHGITPQISIFLLMTDDWEILE